MTPTILFKYPSRSRPERFFNALDSLVNNLYDNENYWISCNLDFDDDKMYCEEVVKRLGKYKNLSIEWGYSTSKVDAINRSTPNIDWDILCVHSDDMVWQFYGYDQIIRQEFLDGDFDKLLHIPDSDAKDMLATYYIAGKTYYQRFNYVYHPSYKSLWCDNEVMDIAKHLGKYKYVDCTGMLHHANGAYGHSEKDAMFIEQQAFWNEDEANYYLRKAINFDL